MAEVPAQYRALGGWVEAPHDMQPALDGHVSADVAIAGGGFAGLCAALELARQGLKVVVLEREFAGYGASGRNAGYLAGGQGLHYESFLGAIGEERARQVVRYYEEGVSFTESRFEELGIDCDYTPSGLIRAGVHPSQESRGRANMRRDIEFGVPAQWLDYADMRARGIPPAFLFGAYMRRGGTLNPGKYVSGLRRAALGAGVMLHERTPLLSYTQGPVIEARTPRGSVSAPALLLTTNAYTPQLGLLGDKVVPLRVSAIETVPLCAARLAALGWAGREGITTAHWIMESHRLTSHGCLVLTTKRLHYPYGSRTPHWPDVSQYDALRKTLHDRFPALRGIALRACWSGYISYANDGLPVVGVTGAHRNLYYAAGCSGHGVGTQGLVGHMLAERIAGCTENPLLTVLMQHATPSMLPDPLRWCSKNFSFMAASRLDDRLNRRVRAGPGH